MTFKHYVTETYKIVTLQFFNRGDIDNDITPIRGTSIQDAAEKYYYDIIAYLNLDEEAAYRHVNDLCRLSVYNDSGTLGFLYCVRNYRQKFIISPKHKQYHNIEDIVTTQKFKDALKDAIFFDIGVISNAIDVGAAVVHLNNKLKKSNDPLFGKDFMDELT